MTISKNLMLNPITTTSSIHAPHNSQTSVTDSLHADLPSYSTSKIELIITSRQLKVQFV